MELHIDGQSIKFVDRKLWKPECFEDKLNFSRKLFTPLTTTTKSHYDEKQIDGRHIKNKCPKEIDHSRKRRILKRPKQFKNYYSNRQAFSIPSYSFPR